MFQYIETLRIETYQYIMFQYIEIYRYIERYLFLQWTLTVYVNDDDSDNHDDVNNDDIDKHDDDNDKADSPMLMMLLRISVHPFVGRSLLYLGSILSRT